MVPPASRPGDEAGARCVAVALPVPLFHPFTYTVPPSMAWPVPAGTRVLVPVRQRREVGIVLGEAAPPDGVALRPLLAVLDDAPALSPALLATAQWMAEWYATPIGVVLRAMLPAALAAPGRPAPAAPVTRTVRLTGELPSLLARERHFARAPLQRAVYERLEAAGGALPLAALRAQGSGALAAVRALAAKGLVAVEAEATARDPFADRAGVAPPAHPSPAQRAAIDAIVAGAPGSTFLLHGVTGSGKTLVYIEVLRAVLRRGDRTAIVLVPEIALTAQTVDRFRGAFGDAVAVLHSGLSDGERLDAWQALRRGDKRIAVGARSALFAPLARVGVVVVDEEHEGSYKQGEAPRYHAREVAMVRARHEGAVVVLGSATPSLESWERAVRGRAVRLVLPDRAAGAQLPPVAAVDLRAVRQAALAARAPQAPFDPALGVLSPALLEAIRGRLARREQVLLLLNRRGYATSVQCHACGDVASCPHCSIALTYHRVPEGLVCHYCQHQAPLPARCPRCGEAALRRQGLGTQQVERLVAERFPEARLARMDVDTTSGKWAHARILDRVAAGEVDILLGTQMIAKGLDFPNVTLVGVVDADTGLNLPDFRAAERTFQLLSQVAGRAGRGPKGGDVIIQTRLPECHAVRHAVRHDYLGFVEEELAARRAPTYPPYVSLLNAVCSAADAEVAAAAAGAVAVWLRARLAARQLTDVTVVGPAPCPVERIKDRWRWHFLVKGARPAVVSHVARLVAEEGPAVAGDAVRLVVDRDPVSLL